MVVYLLAITTIGIWVGRKENKTQVGYFLGGRKFTWWMVGASLFATNISSMQLTAQSGDAYRFGMSAASPQMTGGFMMGVAAMVFIPIYMRTGIYSTPKFLEMRYNKACKLFYSCVFVLKGYLLAPVGVYTGSLAIVKVFNLGEENVWIVAIIMGCTVGLYAIIGGLMSVVVTDTIQIAILIFGCIMVVVFGLASIDDLGVFWSTMKESHLEIVAPMDSDRFPWHGVVSGVALGSLIWASSDAGLLQRVLGAKDLKNAQAGMVFAGFLKVSAVFLIVFPGVIAAYLFPGENPEGVFAVMVRELLPVGLSGLVMMALLAALMSSQDSGVCTVSSIVALELYPLFGKDTSEKRALFVGRCAATCMLLIGVFVAPYMANAGSVYQYVMKVATYLTFPIGICFLGGRFIKRVNHYGAFTVLMIGVPLGILSIIATSIESVGQYAPSYLIEQNFFWVSFLYAIGYLIILVVVSLLTPPPAPEKIAFMTEAIEASKEAEEAGPWYGRLKLWYALFLLMFATVFFVL